MKKQVSFLITSFFILTSISCNNSHSNIEGEWVNCNSSSAHFIITKQGDVFNLHVNANNKDIVLEKKADGLYTNSGGQVTLRYDDSKKHFFLSAIGDQTVELCSLKEVN